MATKFFCKAMRLEQLLLLIQYVVADQFLMKLSGYIEYAQQDNAVTKDVTSCALWCTGTPRCRGMAVEEIDGIQIMCRIFELDEYNFTTISPQKREEQIYLRQFTFWSEQEFNFNVQDQISVVTAAKYIQRLRALKLTRCLENIPVFRNNGMVESPIGTFHQLENRVSPPCESSRKQCNHGCSSEQLLVIEHQNGGYIMMQNSVQWSATCYDGRWTYFDTDSQLVFPVISWNCVRSGGTTTKLSQQTVLDAKAQTLTKSASTMSSLAPEKTSASSAARTASVTLAKGSANITVPTWLEIAPTIKPTGSANSTVSSTAPLTKLLLGLITTSVPKAARTAATPLAAGSANSTVSSTAKATMTTLASGLRNASVLETGKTVSTTLMLGLAGTQTQLAATTIAIPAATGTLTSPRVTGKTTKKAVTPKKKTKKATTKKPTTRKPSTKKPTTKKPTTKKPTTKKPTTKKPTTKKPTTKKPTTKRPTTKKPTTKRKTTKKITPKPVPKVLTRAVGVYSNGIAYSYLKTDTKILPGFTKHPTVFCYSIENVPGCGMVPFGTITKGLGLVSGPATTKAEFILYGYGTKTKGLCNANEKVVHIQTQTFLGWFWTPRSGKCGVY